MTAGEDTPAAPRWSEAEIRAAFREALFYSAPDTEGRLVFGYADPHVYLDTDPYLGKAESALIAALSAVGVGAAPAEEDDGKHEFVVGQYSMHGYLCAVCGELRYGHPQRAHTQEHDSPAVTTHIYTPQPLVPQVEACVQCGGQRADPVHVQQPAEPCDEGCCKNSPCDFQEDNPVHVQRDERAERGDGGRDPHCALPHPHGRSNRCAGD